MLARRRLQVLGHHFSSIQPRRPSSSSSKTGFIDLGGGVRVPKRQPRHPELVPKGYLGDLSQMSEETLGHLRWMAQKDLLGQDCFLLGGPGPSRRWLALSYCELTGREVDYLALSRDTTESDLKQRREILHKRAIFVDQAPVRAATHGRVLLLEGIEKAERNVLPTLNNLLEDRSMALEDGHFIMKPATYDQLLASGSHSAPDLDTRRLRRCHPDFRVVALGLPIPPFHGRTLDPPLRSRFQCRVVDSALSSADPLAAFSSNKLPWSPPSLASQAGTAASPATSINPQIAVFAETLRQLSLADGTGATGTGSALPLFPSWVLPHTSTLLRQFPGCGQGQALARVYPYLYKQEQRQQRTASTSKATDSSTSSSKDTIASLAHKLGVDNMAVGPIFLEARATGQDRQVQLHFEGHVTMAASSGELPPSQGPLPGGFVETPTTKEALTAMLQEHALGRDVCLLGGKGVGKSKLVQLFADRLGYVTETFPLFKDLTPRDLLQRRATDEAGNTTWEDTPLVAAAKTGRLVVLDGIHRLHADTLASLQRLVHDREVELYDGTRLVRQGGAEITAAEGGRATQRVLPIHPSFRIVALGQAEGGGGASSPPSPAGGAGWLHQDVLPLFSWLRLPALTSQEHHQVLQHSFPSLAPRVRQTLMAIEEGLGSKEEGENLTLSTRQLMRLARRVSALPSKTALARLPELVHETLLTNFASAQVREVVNDVLRRVGLRAAAADNVEAEYSSSSSSSSSSSAPSLPIHVTPDTLTIVDVQASRRVPKQVELVPHPSPFYDNPRHVSLLARLLQDYSSGEKAILLVGNQGVGKNKIVDRLLELLNAEREYIQLHRDTTLHSLTVVPNLIDGRIVYEDSPLVRAVQHGRVLVVDEADKAPLEVVMVIKGLMEDGFLLLGDGRKIMASADAAQGSKGKGVIPMHPDFRMIVLANRPGYPFLGNDFFSSSGDVFSCHAIDNPDLASEEQLLASYAPNVPASIRRRLALCFADLRELHQSGMLSYPYSIREAVALIKHIEAFPQDGILTALENVLGFDAYTSPDLRKSLADVFQRRGIPLRASLLSAAAAGDDAGNPPGRPTVDLAKLKPLPSPVSVGHWQVLQAQGPAGRSGVTVREDAQLKGRAWPIQSSTPARYVMETSRMDTFTEEVARIDLRSVLGPYGAPLSLAVTTGRNGVDEDLHVLASGPLRLLSYYGASEGGVGEARRMELLSGPWGNYLDDDPYLVPLSSSLGRNADRVGVVFPRKHYMVVLSARGQPEGGQARLVDLPAFDASSPPAPGNSSWGGNTASTWRIMMGGGGGGPSGGPAAGSDGGLGRVCVLAESKGGSRLVYFRNGCSSLSVMDMEKERITHLQLRDPQTGRALGLERLGVSPAGELLAWSRPSSGEEEKEPGDDEELFVVDGLRFVSGGGGVLVFDNEGNPGAGLGIQKVDVKGTSSGSFAGQSHVVASPTLSSFFLTAPGAHYQAVGPWSEAGALPKEVRAVPRSENAPSDQQHARALRRVGHLVSVMSSASPPSTPNLSMEVTDPDAVASKTIVIQERGVSPSHQSTRGKKSAALRALGVEELGNGSLAVLLNDATLRVLEVEEEALAAQLRDWRMMYPGGIGREEMLRRAEREGEQRRLREKDGVSTPKTGTQAPKHGKEDAKNEPHVGGNTWAGGTGGSDTAGMGGRGGPYRLDRGHQVHQVSDEMKKQVSAEAKQEAKHLAKEALAKRLKEIGMSQGDWALYDSILSRVQPQIQQLRQILDGMQSKAKEREWVRHQTHGELDDSKLVDGMAGERLVFKRRAEVEEDPSPLSSTQKPKPKRRMLFVLDCSGSMYRFNGEDGRLDRMLEVAAMVMESFEGRLENSGLEYALVGHSGDASRLPLVEFGKPPGTRKEKLAVLENMAVHAQYCMTGDHTREATQQAVEELAAYQHQTMEDGNDFVFVVSDANFQRYRIDPRDLGEALVKHPTVRGHIFLIANLGDEASYSVQDMPVGRGHLCLDLQSLPSMLKSIFVDELTTKE